MAAAGRYHHCSRRYLHLRRTCASVSNFNVAAPTATPTATRVRPTVTLAITPTAVPPTASPTPDIPTAIDKGVYVAVVDGVNFRNEASTTAQIIRTLGAGEVLQVIDGPVSAGDRIWWKLKVPMAWKAGRCRTSYRPRHRRNNAERQREVL